MLRVRICEASILNHNDGKNDDDKDDWRTEDTGMEITMRVWMENSKCNSSTSW